MAGWHFYFWRTVIPFLWHFGSAFPPKLERQLDKPKKYVASYWDCQHTALFSFQNQVGHKTNKGNSWESNKLWLDCFIFRGHWSATAYNSYGLRVLWEIVVFVQVIAVGRRGYQPADRLGAVLQAGCCVSLRGLCWDGLLFVQPLCFPSSFWVFFFSAWKIYTMWADLNDSRWCLLLGVGSGRTRLLCPVSASHRYWVPDGITVWLRTFWMVTLILFIIAQSFVDWDFFENRLLSSFKSRTAFAFPVPPLFGASMPFK